MLRRIYIISVTSAILFFLYVAIMNMNTLDLSGRQKILKAIYPIFTSWQRIVGKNADILLNKKGIKPSESVYDITIVLNDGTSQPLSAYRGKKILFVNTASDCGYTAQYDGLQKLYEQNSGKLIVIGFPANDFKEQEKGTDAEIGAFCRKNFGVSFPLAEKGSVIAGDHQQAIYRWLTDKNKNGWNEKFPSWNFSKYLVNEEGVLTHYFGPSVTPESKTVADALIK